MGERVSGGGYCGHHLGWGDCGYAAGIGFGGGLSGVGTLGFPGGDCIGEEYGGLWVSEDSRPVGCGGLGRGVGLNSSPYPGCLSEGAYRCGWE